MFIILTILLSNSDVQHELMAPVAWIAGVLENSAVMLKVHSVMVALQAFSLKLTLRGSSHHTQFS